MAENPLDLAMEVEHDNRKLVLRLADFTGEDDLLYAQKTGVSLTEFFSGKLTLYTLAGVIWLKRRRTEPELTFEDVNKQVSFQTLTTISTPSGGEASPEA